MKKSWICISGETIRMAGWTHKRHGRKEMQVSERKRRDFESYAADLLSLMSVVIEPPSSVKSSAWLSCRMTCRHVGMDLNCKSILLLCSHPPTILYIFDIYVTTLLQLHIYKREERKSRVKIPVKFMYFLRTPSHLIFIYMFNKIFIRQKFY